MIYYAVVQHDFCIKERYVHGLYTTLKDAVAYITDTTVETMHRQQLPNGLTRYSLGSYQYTVDEVRVEEPVYDIS
jgi:hypothetical protein